jgi:hypothetical protein
MVGWVVGVAEVGMGTSCFGGTVRCCSTELVHWQENELFLAESWLTREPSSGERWLDGLRLAGGMAGEQYDGTS